jgi:hypothetical protein
MQFIRSGTGASTAQFSAADAGALVTNTVNKLLVRDNTVRITIVPTSAAGLSAGDIWNDGGTLKIVT